MVESEKTAIIFGLTIFLAILFGIGLASLLNLKHGLNDIGDACLHSNIEVEKCDELFDYLKDPGKYHRQ